MPLQRIVLRSVLIACIAFYAVLRRLTAAYYDPLCRRARPVSPATVKFIVGEEKAIRGASILDLSSATGLIRGWLGGHDIGGH